MKQNKLDFRLLSLPYVLIYLVLRDLYFRRSTTTHLLLLPVALPLTEHGAKWVRLKVPLIALLLICLDFKELEGQVSINMRYTTINLMILQALLVALSTMKPATQLRRYNYF